MYRCPECGSTEVKVVRYFTVIEYWDGEECESEDGGDERAPEPATIECMDCGYEDPSIGCLDEWWVSE